jgi:hypothetical protein
MQLSRAITSINRTPSNNGTSLWVWQARVLVIVVALLSGCKQDPVDDSIKRIRMGDILVAFISNRTVTPDFEFSGRIRAYDTRDSLFEAPGIGQFKHFISLRDTASTDSVRLFYSLPSNVNFRIDSTQRFTLIYRKIDPRFALILKTKNDSLVCAVGTLLPDEWPFVLNRAGNQGFRVSVGDNLYLARNTECGREGDFDIIVANNSGEVRVGPARSAFLFSGDKAYAVFNVVNTKLIKDLGTCAAFVPEFAFMILQQ